MTTCDQDAHKHFYFIQMIIHVLRVDDAADKRFLNYSSLQNAARTRSMTYRFLCSLTLSRD